MKFKNTNNTSNCWYLAIILNQNEYKWVSEIKQFSKHVDAQSINYYYIKFLLIFQNVIKFSYYCYLFINYTYINHNC